MKKKNRGVRTVINKYYKVCIIENCSPKLLEVKENKYIHLLKTLRPLGLNTANPFGFSMFHVYISSCNFVLFLYVCVILCCLIFIFMFACRIISFFLCTVVFTHTHIPPYTECQILRFILVTCHRR